MSHDHDDLRSMFERARRHDESLAPDLDVLMTLQPARPSRWSVRPALLWGGAGLLATVASAALAVLLLPLETDAPPQAVIHDTDQRFSSAPGEIAYPVPPPAEGGGAAGFGTGVALGGGVEPPVSSANEPAPAEIAEKLDSLGYVGDKRGVVGGVTGGVVGGVLGGVPGNARTEYLASNPPPPPRPNEPLVASVDVLAQRAPANDQETPQSVRFSDEFLKDLPVQGRSYQNVVIMAPGIQDSDGDGNPNVHGARAADFKTVGRGAGALEGVTVVPGKAGGVKKEKEGELREGPSTERYGKIQENDFLATAENPLSTFSIDVDTASYSVVRRHLIRGMLPPANAVRIEELVNYFPYSYPPPTGGDPFSVNVEIASCPWADTHRIARIGLHGREARRESKGANLVFLIDVSGSMDVPEKLPLLKKSLSMLVDQLGAGDQVAIVVYAGASGLVLPSTSGSRGSEIRAAIERLESGGSTNGGEGLKLAYQVARDHLIRGGVNRVILATDGDFNVGVTDQGELLRMVEREAKAGVALTALGFGMGNYNDDMLQTLADRGNGNHFYIDDEPEARKVLVQQIGGTLVTIAKDVKIQVEFNPRKVGAYRLLGYENRMLKKEDFNDDRKDAGEIGSGHDVTALYELVPPGEASATPSVDPLKYQMRTAPAAESDESFTVKLRYKDPDGETSRLLSYAATDPGTSLAAASEDTRFQVAVALFGMVLRGSEHRASADFDLVRRLASAGLGADQDGYRRDFLDLIEKARSMQPR